MTTEFDNRSEHLKPTKQTAMFVLICKNDVLLEERIEKGKSFYGMLIIPAGKFDPALDKCIKDTAVREAKEEYGINFSDCELLGKFEDITPHNNHYLVSVFVKESSNIVVNNRENTKHIPHWINLYEAEKGLVFAKDILAIKMARKYLSR